MLLELAIITATAHAWGTGDVETATAYAAVTEAIRYAVPSPPTPQPASKLHRDYENEVQCARAVFAVVNHEQTENVWSRYALVSSYPSSVDVLEKRGATDLIRISYQWPGGPGGIYPVNPGYFARVSLELKEFHPKKIWTEYFSKYCY